MSSFCNFNSSPLTFSDDLTADKRLPFQGVQLFENLDFATRSRYELTIPIRKRGNARIAVVVEELSTSAWGGVACEPPPK